MYFIKHEINHKNVLRPSLPTVPYLGQTISTETKENHEEKNEMTYADVARQNNGKTDTFDDSDYLKVVRAARRTS